MLYSQQCDNFVKLEKTAALIFYLSNGKVGNNSNRSWLVENNIFISRPDKSNFRFNPFCANVFI